MLLCPWNSSCAPLPSLLTRTLRVQVRSETLKKVAGLQALDAARAAGAAVLLSTHVLDTLEKVATRILMVQGGRLIADVGADELASPMLWVESVVG